jgi:hypothetical protein
MANNPNNYTNITPNTWTKIASNVTSAIINIQSGEFNNFYVDYRLTGQSAPTNQTYAVQLISLSTTITNTSAIDIYIYFNNTLTPNNSTGSLVVWS